MNINNNALHCNIINEPQKPTKMACKSRLNLGIDSGLSEPGLEALEDGHNDLQLGFRQLAVLRPGVWGWGGHYY